MGANPIHDPAAPGFGIIAIVESEAGVGHVLTLARELPAYRLALMLRDPDHRAARVADLARHLLAASIPPNLVPIANAHRVPGIPWLHLTSSQLAGWAPDGLPFGASAHGIEEGMVAARLGAGYVTFSPIFPTSSKPGHPGVGLAALRDFCAAVPLPVFALGGIDIANAADCIDAGARGIAMRKL
jgi:hypothetical protein